MPENNFKEVEFTDHEFSAWLFDQVGVTGEWSYKRQPSKGKFGHTDFFNGKERIAYAIYDNKACTKKTFIKESDDAN